MRRFGNAVHASPLLRPLTNDSVGRELAADEGHAGVEAEGLFDAALEVLHSAEVGQAGGALGAGEDVIQLPADSILRAHNRRH